MIQSQTISEPELTDTTDDNEITVGVAEYLSFWGCDPCYDKPPRLPGDGYIFYNYGPECNDRNYLEHKLLPAIRRQLECGKMIAEDRDNFKTIMTYVLALLADSGRGATKDSRI